MVEYLAPIFLISFSLAWSLYFILKTIRIRWVYRARTKMISEEYNEYEKLVSWDEMIRRWWVWDVEEFKNKQEL